MKSYIICEKIYTYCFFIIYWFYQYVFLYYRPICEKIALSLCRIFVGQKLIIAQHVVYIMGSNIL